MNIFYIKYNSYFSVIPKLSGTPNQIRIEGISTINRRMVERVIWLSAHGVRLLPIVESGLANY